MNKRKLDTFLEPGDRLKSKHGESLVVIEGATLTGYRGTSYKRDSFGEIDAKPVLIGENWLNSYTKTCKNAKGKPIAIEDQVPVPPLAGGYERVNDAFYEARRLVEEGWSMTQACRQAGLSEVSYYRRFKKLQDAEKMANVEEEFNK